VDSVVDLCLDSIHEPSPELIEIIRDVHLKASTQPLRFGLAAMLDPSKGPRVLVAAVIHGSPASLALVGEALAAMSVGSPAARVVTDALLRRGITGEPLQSTLTRMLSEDSSRKFATRALLQIETDLAHRALLSYYGAGAIPDDDRDSAWSALLGLLETPLGDAAALVMRDWYERRQTSAAPYHLRFLPRLGVADAHERLLGIASKDTSWHEQQQEAIAGLFAIDPEAALGCAQRLFTRLHAKSRWRFLHELASQGDETAIPVLCRLALQEKDGPSRADVGRNLRRFDPVEVEAHLRPMLEDRSEFTRLRAIELAGWQPDGLLATELAKLAADDPEPDARVAAAAACRRQRSERLTLQLMAELQSSSGANLRLGLVSALVERVDPFLAEIRGDRLFVFDLLKSAREEIYADAVLRRRRGAEDQTR
jgi:HEAT repeat protein